MSANVALTDSFDQWRVKTNEVMVMTQTDGMSNFIKVLDTTNSTSNTTGSIITAGGLGVLKSAVIGENLRIHGNVITDGDTTISGNLVFGDADTDQVSFSADINSNLIPNANLTFNIGNTTMFWANTWTGHVGVTQKVDSGKPAITVTSQDADVGGILVTAGQDAANVFHIQADSLTTGTGLSIQVDALTTGTALTCNSNAGVGTRNVVEITNDNVLAVGATPLYVKNDSTNTVAKFIGTSTIVIPAGTTAQRGTAVQGGVRYNTTLSSFEGYSGSQWGSLGGLIDVDRDTYVLAETSAGADGDDLDFYTAGTQRMKIDQAGAFTLTGTVTVGVDNVGHDVKFFGDTATTGYMLWDQSTDDLILGSSSRIGIGTTAPLVDLDVSVSGGVAGETDGIAQFNWSTTAAAGGRLRLGHSNHATIGNYAAVDAADVLGQITFEGSDGGSDAFWTGAAIKATAAETWTAPSGSTSEAGSYLTFHTTDIGTPNLDERMRITDAGNVGIGNTGPASKLHVTGTVQVGVDGTGYDVTFFGDTATRYMLWDQDEDALHFQDNTEIKLGNKGPGDMTLVHDGTNSYIRNETGILKISTETSAGPVTIGHTTSVVTIGDNLTVTDTLTELSMREMKTNIEPIENILPAVLQMQGVSFDWKKDEDRGLTNYGFIAEDVDKIFPNLVSHDEEGKAQGIQYSKMTAVLLEAIKEQQVQIEELKSKILN